MTERFDVNTTVLVLVNKWETGKVSITHIQVELFTRVLLNHKQLERDRDISKYVSLFGGTPSNLIFVVFWKRQS